MKATFRLFLFCAASHVVPVAHAAPQWWEKRGLIDLNRPTVDQGVLLIGQAKQAIFLASQEFEEKLHGLGGAGTRVREIIANEAFKDTSKDKNPLVVGQLKHLIQPFYDRLAALNITASNLGEGGLNPWTGDTPDDADSSLTVLGQLKFVVSFDLDADADDLPDWWEKRVLGTMEETAKSDHDGDGLNNGEEWRQGTSPLLMDTDGDGVDDAKDREPLAYTAPPPRKDDGKLEVFTLMVPKEKEDEIREKARQEQGQPDNAPEGQGKP